MDKTRIILDDIKDEKPKFKIGDLVKTKKGKLINVNEAKWQIGLIVHIDEWQSYEPARKYFKWKYVVAWPDGSKKKYSAGALVKVNGT